MPIGFLGMGTMGLPMAHNLLRGGFEISVWNRSPERARSLRDAGATVVDAPVGAACGPLLFSMLADDAAVRQTVLDGGVLDALPAGSVHVNMATISVALAHELTALHAERGIAYVAAPVLGRVDVAEAGKLNILAAGDAAALARVQPMFDVLGQKTWHIGDTPEQANAVKLAANFCLASAIGAMAEASALARGHGVDATQFLGMLTTTLFAAPAYQGYGKLIMQRQYTPAGFTATLGRKDVDLAIQAGADKQVPMPLGELLRASLDQAIAHGDGNADWAVLAEVSARRAGQA
ncbi:NAD(P)-dependent oxidoreductase [Xanthomonas floridensis]|uniref:Oxidoreductase n=1 Tax=Xanthomonas floridensis TaxID=1843580 RepID=A0A1A9MAF5_9XANT|nr:NAD(P)-dependent oxidoreductase [Xanthomonas floridensis]MEA5126240.1 NAD(P)-dependent oxidoreductase [Xanthomonas floridensis]MEA5134184.1 NAD(P)-dependent oxidoreductase [Xanthomonas floridensis]OAG66597.1 oxidoreductase [Xanthomonas floridensis]